MKILVLAPNHEIYRLYLEILKKVVPFNSRDVVHVEWEHDYLGHDPETPVVMIGSNFPRMIGVQQDIRARFKNIKAVPDLHSFGVSLR